MGVQEYTYEEGPVAAHYAAAGPDDAHPVILLHGVTHRWQAFDEIMPLLAEHFHVYALDLRGHGLSGRAAPEYRAADFAADILEVVHAVTGTPVNLVGHSLGALVALQVAAALQDEAAALVLMEPPLLHARTSLAGTQWQAHFERTLHLVKTTDSAVEIEEVLRKRLPDAPPTVLWGMAQRLRKVDPAVLETLLSQDFMRGYKLTAYLERVVCPILLLQADPDANSVLEPVDIQLVKQHASSCQHRIIPDAIHTMHFSHPLRVGAALVEFLGGRIPGQHRDA